jgi:hypothetical protein
VRKDLDYVLYKENKELFDLLVPILVVGKVVINGVQSGSIHYLEIV